MRRKSAGYPRGEHERTGRLVAAGDPAAFRAALESVLALPGNGRELGVAGRARAREAFSVEAMAASYRALYRRVGSSD